MSAIPLIFGIWVQHVIFALLFASPALYFGRRRAHWESQDLLGLIVPFGIWIALMLTPWARGKTLGNVLVEGLWLSAGVAVGAVVRVWMSDIPRRRRYFVGLLGAVCLVGIVAFVVTPPMPE